MTGFLNRLWRGGRVLLPGLVAAGLWGCISTTEGGFTTEASPEKAVEQRVALARQYIGEGSWENAKRNLEMAHAIDPNNAEVHEAFALVFQSTGEFELADEHFRRSVKLDSNCSRCRNNYAAFLYSQGEYEKAEKQLRVVIKDTMYNARPQAFVNLGLCQLQLSDRAGAEESFNRALAMDRTNRIALLESAQMRYDDGDYVAANKYYDTYRKLTRQQSARGLWLGVRLARHSGDRDAEASYSLVLSNLYPDSPEYRELQKAQP